MTDERVPDAVRPHYEDAVRVLEAVGAQASHVDEKTARAAMKLAAQKLPIQTKFVTRAEQEGGVI
jgi:ribosomal protein L16/L10AE